MVYLIRFITATCLFALLGKANIWMNSISNIILAMGYRFFLILSPLLPKVFGRYSIGAALMVAALGMVFFCLQSNFFMVLGAVLVGIGLSVSGYLIKTEVSETPCGAAYNKIALNAGSLLSGLILLFYLGTKNSFFFGAAAFLVFGGMVSIIHSHKQKEVRLPIPRSFCLRRFIGWSFVGISIGIKLFGVFSVLPQYLMSHLGKLPNWYGFMVFINSIVIILLQLPIINFIDKVKQKNNSTKVTLAFMLLGMVIIAFPQAFYAHLFWGALLWTILLSLVECCASYLDVEGSRAGYLLIKETSVGLGAGITVLISRYFAPSISGITTGCVGVMVILTAIVFLHKDLFILRK